MGPSMVSCPTSLERRTRERFGSEANSALNRSWQIGGLFPSFPFATADRGAVAPTLGLGYVGVSADATRRVVGQSYLVVNANALGNYEAIVQQRLLCANKRGMSVDSSYCWL